MNPKTVDNEQTGLRPIDELNLLSATVDSVWELGDLKPIFARAEEIAKQHSGSTDIELLVKQIKTQLVIRGKKLKEAVAVSPRSENPSLPSILRHEAETGPVIPIPNFPSGENPVRVSGQLPSYSQFPDQPLPRPTGAIGIPSAPPKPTGRPTAGVFAVPPIPTGPPPPSRKGLNWKSAMAIGAAIGLAGAIGILVTIVSVAKKHNNPQTPISSTLAAINITTVPPGARIQINSEEKCVSPCKLQLAPGDYRVQAQLEGYDPTLSPHSLVAGQLPLEVTMTLNSQAQSLRIFSDIAGKVQLDGKPQPDDIAEGSFILDRVAAGLHTVSVTGSRADASFTFEVTPGKAPAIKGPTTAHNLLAVVVSNAGTVARMQSSTGPLKALLDGKEQPAIAVSGTDFPNVPNGYHELVVGEGKDLKKIQVSFLPTPTLTAYLRSDINAGTLVVATNPPEDDVMVVVNGRQLRKTSRGTVSVQLPPGNVTVRVIKDGFEAVADQPAVVKKGEDTRLEFRLKSLPRVATLRIRAVTSGATIYLDGREIGKVNAEGNFQTGGVTPGDHEIEFRMAGYLNKKHTQLFKAGETVEVANDSLLKDQGIISVVVSPPETKITFRRENETEKSISGTSIAGLAPGRYFVTGKASGYKDKTVPVTVAGNQTSMVDLALAKDTPVVIVPTTRSGSIRDFAPAWTADGDLYTHAGTSSALGITPVLGTLRFKVQLIKGGLVNKKIRWAIGFGDGKTHTAFEIEKNKFRHSLYNGGKQNKGAPFDLAPADVYDVSIEVTSGRITTRINNVVVDQVLDAPNLTTGKFIFLLGDKDELGISGFAFVPTK